MKKLKGMLGITVVRELSKLSTSARKVVIKMFLFMKQMWYLEFKI